MILIFVVFMITVMAVVGTVLLLNVSNYYADTFFEQTETALAEGSSLRNELLNAMNGEDFVSTQKNILTAYSSTLGIDAYRNFYILDLDGNMLDGSDRRETSSMTKTQNLLAAMSGKAQKSETGLEYTDYAVRLENGENSCIVYIIDTQEERGELSWRLFSIILQTVFIGIAIAIILSFFLAKAIMSPIQNLTQGAQMVASGDFSYEIHVRSKDEIGILTKTFNYMRETLKTNLDEINGEKEKIHTVFSHLSEPVIAFSRNGDVMNINDSAKKLLGKDYTADFNFEKLTELLNIDSTRETIYLDENDNEKSYVYHDRQYHGRVLDVTFGVIRYVENKRNTLGILAVIHDITSRYELDKSRREFVANVSHELRTPLTGIIGATETVLNYPDMPEETQTEFLHMAVDESNRMLRIVTDLLTLSRLDDNRAQWKVSTFEIGSVLHHLCEVMKFDSDTHGHTLIYQEIEKDLPFVTGDKEKIEQVITNVISNSIKYTPDGGKIEVSAQQNDERDSIIICVSDNGIGIPQEDIPRLFERFYRVEKARSSKAGGTGLGLAIAKEIVEAHGGDIRVESQPGCGTTVCIRIPFHSQLSI